MLDSSLAFLDAPPAIGTDPLRSATTGPDRLSRCLRGGNSHVIAAKDHVFRDGDTATHIYRVDSGHICLYRMLPDGRRQVVDFAYPGDLIGLGAIGEYTACAQAIEPTRVTSFSLSNVHETARQDHSFGLKLYEALSQELLATRELLITVCQRTACERVAGFLLALSRRSRRRSGCAQEIVLPMTRGDIADFLGLTVETVSRTFTKFRVEGIIDIEQCILVTILDHAALENSASGGTASRRRLGQVS